ncbi:MAG: hypothetical protein IKR83_04470 [Bacteroidales bacterium]|nr:hypothetical protein [Bacteroidales bacterium]
MDKKQFAEMVAHPERFTPQDRGWLRAMVDRYPHSSLMTTLALLADHVYRFDTIEERRAVMLSMCNSENLDAMLERASSPADDPQTDILNEINTFQEVSFKTAPKSVILSNFLQAAPANSTEKPIVTDESANADEKKSLRTDQSIGTETLAVILEQQGHYDRALAIYKNLLAQNPEKSSTFAPRIQKLEALIKK